MLSLRRAPSTQCRGGESYTRRLPLEQTLSVAPHLPTSFPLPCLHFAARLPVHIAVLIAPVQVQRVFAATQGAVLSFVTMCSDPCSGR